MMRFRVVSPLATHYALIYTVHMGRFTRFALRRSAQLLSTVPEFSEA